MKKRKIQKGRALSIMTLGLAAVSLVSVGFSAWVIQMEANVTASQITASVAEVENQTVTFETITLGNDTSIHFDAADGDNKGSIIAKDIVQSGEPGAPDYMYSFAFKTVLLDTQAYSAIEGKQTFKGLTIQTVEVVNNDYDAEEDKTFHQLSSFVNATTGVQGLTGRDGDKQVISTPTIINSAVKRTTTGNQTVDHVVSSGNTVSAKMPLVASDALNFGNSTEPKTIYLMKKDVIYTAATETEPSNNGIDLKDVTSTLTEPDGADFSKWNIKIVIEKEKLLETTGIDNDYTYTFTCTFKVNYGEKYKGLNPSLCDGAEQDAFYTAAGFTKTGDEFNLPPVKDIKNSNDAVLYDGIATDLKNLYSANGNKLEHTIFHSPTEDKIEITKPQ